MKKTIDAPTTPATPIDLNQALLRSGIISVQGYIRTSKITDIISTIFAYEALNYTSLTIYINSLGGEAAAAFALVDVIQHSKLKITTIALGEICSCGLIIFLAGDTRLIYPNTSVLSHQFSSSSDGKYHELKAAIPEFELLKERMFSLYLHATGLARATIERYLLPPHDVWLTPKQCLKYHIAHKIMPRGKKPA